MLWQDPSAVVVDKPWGVLVHNSAWAGPREDTLVDQLQARLGVAVFPVHRLDRGTSGVVLCARSRDGVAAWQAALAAPEAHKDYLALVRGQLPDAVDVDHPVKDDNGTRQPARSSILPLARSALERCSLVRVRLHTGRWHQARQHLKHLSHPVLGDSTHGKGPLNRFMAEHYGLKRMGLHAWRLALEHPETGQPVNVEAPLPEDLQGPLRRLLGDAELEAALARGRA